MKTNRNQIQDRKLPNFGHIPFLFAIISCAGKLLKSMQTHHFLLYINFIQFNLVGPDL